MSEKRFIQLGDTHIKDTVTGEEWYAPCETSLLDLLNEQQSTIEQLEKDKAILKERLRECGRRLDRFNCR